MRIRRLAALLFLSLGVCACGETREIPAVKPDLPESVPPAWKLTSFDRSTAPELIPYPSSKDAVVKGYKVPQGSPDCWQATYTGDGAALIWICRYGAGNGISSSVSSFDAWQRVRADSRTVKFQEGEYLVLVKGNNAPNADLLALMRAVQTAIGKK